MDTYHYYGSDWQLSSNNDLLKTYHPEEGSQRLIRRILTVPGQYVWHPDYGVGAGQYIGNGLSDRDLNRLKALIIAQIYQESFVGRTPPAEINLTRQDRGLLCVIKYYDIVIEDYQVVNFTIYSE